LPPPSLLARPAFRQRRTGAGLALHQLSLASLGLRLPEKFSLKGKGELFIVFLAPPARARKTFLLPKPTWPFSTILAKFKLEN